MTAHIPVMLQEVVDLASGCAMVCDATMGAAGHSRALLESDAKRVVYAIDQDPSVQGYADQLKSQFSRRFHFIAGNFGRLAMLLRRQGVDKVDFVLMDLGFSSMQADRPERGFSFRAEGPLDMRMSGAGLSAEEVVNDYPPEKLITIIRRLGEEPLARKIVQNIVRHRTQRRITTTGYLAEIVREVKQRRGAKIDPATQTFQAIRIHVNAELEMLEQGLEAAEAVLNPGGVLCALSFHSLEDRIVKRFFRSRIAQPQNSRHLPPQDMPPAAFELLHRGVVRASAAEVSCNPRARSAKLRAARKLEALK